MSSYFIIKIKEKGKSVSEQKMPTILWFSTTIARELKTEISSLKYSDSFELKEEETLDEYSFKYEKTAIRYNVLDENTINDIISYLKDEIKRYEDYETETTLKNDKYYELATKAKNREVCEYFLEMIENDVCYKVEIEEIKNTLFKFEFLKYNLLEDIDNKDFELVYTLD